MSFAGLLSEAQPRDTGLALAVPDSWHQGRTAYGGFSAALALSVALEVGGEGLPPLRSAAVSFVGPVHGEVEVHARVLRRGKNATWISAELSRASEAALVASFVFMGSVESALHLNEIDAPADLIAPDAAAIYKPHAHMPVFLDNHFEVRFALPRNAEKRPELCWWVRLKERAGLDAMTEVMLIGDALPPGVLPLLKPATSVSSMTWQVNLLTSAPRTHDGWWLLHSVGDYSQSGCSSQHMTIWNAEGEPIASGMQSIAVFG